MNRAPDQLPAPGPVCTQWAEEATRILGFWRKALGLSAVDEAFWLPLEERHVVTQGRALWNFSTAYRVAAALAQEVESTEDRCWADAAADALISGFFNEQQEALTWWPRDSDAWSGQGRPVFQDLYGTAFGIFGLAAHGIATGSEASNETALRIAVQADRRLFDKSTGFWREQATLDWHVPDREDPTGAGIQGRASANAHLHWMEALMELFSATGDERAGEMLGRALDVVMGVFFPTDPSKAVSFLDPSRPGSLEAEDEISPGHVVEAAWLMLRAQWLLGRTPDPTRFGDTMTWARSLVGPSQTLPYAVDRTGRVLDDARVWWVQNEWLAALAHEETANAQAIDRRFSAMDAVASYCLGTLADPKYRVPRSIAAIDGGIIDGRLLEPWKVGYHDLRSRWIVAGRY